MIKIEFPWDYLREIFSGCQWMAKIPNAVEILRKIWTAWVGCTNVTDDRQIDGRAIAYSEREREFTEFTFAKNYRKRRFLRPWNVKKCQITRASPRTPLGELTVLSQSDLIRGGEGNSPSLRIPPLLPHIQEWRSWKLVTLFSWHMKTWIFNCHIFCV